MFYPQRFISGSILSLCACFSLASLDHRVEENETLYSLSHRYSVPVHLILRVNNLSSETIKTGQKLIIPVDEPSQIIVRAGDTLSSLAGLLNMSQQDIAAVNNLDADKLRIGQILKIPAPNPPGSHRVLPGDTLLGIALRYSIPVDILKAYNSLDSDVIHPGEILDIQAPRPASHLVLAGESLWSISKKYNISVDNIRKWNNINNEEHIHRGKNLTLYPVQIDLPQLGSSSPVESHSIVKLASVANREKTVPELPAFGEYFYTAPNKVNQPTVSYWEGAAASPKTDYSRAMKVLSLYDNEVSRLPALSDKLSGWHVVLDPGHGGLDPGAIVEVRDGNGNPVVVTEDEYAYDITMRLYRLLRRHGASVSLTVIAPDHHVRDGENARQTFVNLKSEVYADREHNENEGWRPVGTSGGLEMRKIIAEESILKVKESSGKKGTLFISIHADNSADLPEGRAVLYDGIDNEEAARSKALAAVMSRHLGSASFLKRQKLQVLQNNPADAAVLVETRNIHYPNNAWALRSAILREQDARMICAGILAWTDR